MLTLRVDKRSKYYYNAYLVAPATKVVSDTLFWEVSCKKSNNEKNDVYVRNAIIISSIFIF